ncbi:hypothetical protein K7432_007197 [Basidiobolus ranarum]|uniref:Uncharacterized protein n=1 Tax=Basidiobolus ranarum TaxID=34480 RepID=A0ABR2WTS0_9FUNG
MGDYGKHKMRRLSEPRISKSCNSVSLTNEDILLSHQDIHHNPLLLDTHSIQQYSSIGPGTLLRGHSMDSTNWDLSAKISNNYGNYVGKSQHTSNHMNFSASFSMNSIQVSQAGIPLDGSMSSVSSTPIPYMDDMNYSIYASGENFL